MGDTDQSSESITREKNNCILKKKVALKILFEFLDY